MSYNFSGYYVKTPNFRSVAEIFESVMREKGATTERVSKYARDYVSITGFPDGYTTICCNASRELTDRLAEELKTDVYTYGTYEHVGQKYLYTRRQKPADSVLIATGDESYLSEIDLANLVNLAKQDPNYKISPFQKSIKDFEYDAIDLYNRYILKLELEEILVNAIDPEVGSPNKYLEKPIYINVEIPKSLNCFGHVPRSLVRAFPEKFPGQEKDQTSQDASYSSVTATPLPVASTKKSSLHRPSLGRIIWVILTRLIRG